MLVETATSNTKNGPPSGAPAVVVPLDVPAHLLAVRVAEAAIAREVTVLHTSPHPFIVLRTYTDMAQRTAEVSSPFYVFIIRPGTLFLRRIWLFCMFLIPLPPVSLTSAGFPSTVPVLVSPLSFKFHSFTSHQPKRPNQSCYLIVYNTNR